MTSLSNFWLQEGWGAALLSDKPVFQCFLCLLPLVCFSFGVVSSHLITCALRFDSPDMHKMIHRCNYEVVQESITLIYIM